MTRLVLVVPAVLAFAACGGTPQSSGSPTAGSTERASGGAGDEGGEGGEEGEGKDDANEFQIRDSDTAGEARGVHPTHIESTETEAAVRFFVVDKDEGPIEGIVIKLTAPDGTEYYTLETDAKGFAEVLVPVDAKYDLTYLSLGRRDIKAQVDVPDKPNQDLKLTLRYKRHDRPGSQAQAGDGSPGASFVLEGIRFDTGKATLREGSHARLGEVVEYMTHKKSARIEVSGHTDNVGSAASNKTLSRKRAQAVREYLVSQGIDGSRIEAVGHGAEQPIAPNDTEEGRQKNRRIEVTEIR